MESLIRILIYLHALLGGLGLLTGAVSIAVKKGGAVHRRSGKIFSIAMVGSAGLSLFIAVMPGHENLFLFLIGVFTIYLVLAGNRALTFKGSGKVRAGLTDKTISGIMLFGSVAMVLVGAYRLFNGLPNSVLFLFFGVFGTILTLADFKNFRTFTKKKANWLKIHIGRMVGAMIASVTAFIVAGLDFNNLFAWMFPTVFGTVYIVYWIRRIDGPKRIS